MRFLCRGDGPYITLRSEELCDLGGPCYQAANSSERSQLRCVEASLGSALGMTHWEETPGIPRTCQKDYISHLSWEHLGMPKEEPVPGKKNSGLLCSRYWHFDPYQDKWFKDGWIGGWMSSNNSIALVNLVGVCPNGNAMFLTQERTQTTSSCKQHITTSYKKKITTKSFHPFHQILSYKSFFSARLSAVDSFVCFRCSFILYIHRLSVPVIKLITHRTSI